LAITAVITIAIFFPNGRLRSDLLCVVWDAKPYTLTHPSLMVTVATVSIHYAYQEGYARLESIPQ